MPNCCKASCCSTLAVFMCWMLHRRYRLLTQPHPDAIQHTLAFLAESYEFVVVDSPPGLSEDTCASIRQSDRLAIIITPELPAIHNAIRAIEYLTGLHYPGDSIDIVLNRYSRRSTLDDREIEASLRRTIAVRVPNNYAQIVTAINAGIPIDRARKSELPTAFDAWADRLIGEEPGTATRQRWIEEVVQSLWRLVKEEIDGEHKDVRPRHAHRRWYVDSYSAERRCFCEGVPGPEDGRYTENYWGRLTSSG